MWWHDKMSWSFGMNIGFKIKFNWVLILALPLSSSMYFGKNFLLLFVSLFLPFLSFNFYLNRTSNDCFSFIYSTIIYWSTNMYI